MEVKYDKMVSFCLIHLNLQIPLKLNGRSEGVEDPSSKSCGCLIMVSLNHFFWILLIFIPEPDLFEVNNLQIEPKICIEFKINYDTECKDLVNSSEPLI